MTDDKRLLRHRLRSRIQKFAFFSFCMVFSFRILAQDSSQIVEFDASFLRSDIDISQFSQGNPVHPGTHLVDLYLNNVWKGLQGIRFEQLAPNALIASPCFEIQVFYVLGVDVNKLSKEQLSLLSKGESCVQLDSILQGSSVNFDSAAQRLDVTVPQIYLNRQARGYINSELWDHGITAAMLQYDYNIYHSEYSQFNSLTYQYLGLRGGANWKAWRLRYRGAFRWDSTTSNLHYQNSAIYLERGITPLKSKLVLGDASTDGQVFDSLRFRGIQISSDDRMLPDSQRGYAPIVRGIARTNALVIITQNASVLYEATVPPGPFVIDDLYPSGSGGELVVTIREADGQEHGFTVPYSSIAELLRPGATRYSLTAGQFRSFATQDEPMLAIGTLRHGFSNWLTGYGGILGAQNYQAVSLGIAINTKLGAFSLDSTQAYTKVDGLPTQEGNNLRAAYVKTASRTGTNLMLTANRTTGRGYYSAQDAMTLSHDIKHGFIRKIDVQGYRNRFTLAFSQNLPANYGAFSTNFSYQDYWSDQRSTLQYQINYSNHYKRLNYNIAAQRIRRLDRSGWENQIMVSVSIPLGGGSNAPSLTSSYSSMSDSSSLNASVSGGIGADRQVTYSVFTNTVHQRAGGTSTSAGANATWNASRATVSGGVSKGENFTQYNANLSGGLVAYSNGVVLTPIIGDTFTIVEAEGAEGARINGSSQHRLDGHGRGVAPYLLPYRRNMVEIDPQGLSTDVEIKNSSQYTVPTSGAVTLLNFATDVGYSLLIRGQKVNGEPLPFGASILNASGENVGYIAQGGQAIIRVQEIQGELQVKWGNAQEEQCHFEYRLPETDLLTHGNFRRLDILCH